MENSNRNKPGIKLLLSMKGAIDDDDLEDLDIERNNEDYIEEITDEDYKKNVREMDDFIFDIIRTKQEIKLTKLKSRIKTKQDLLDFINVRDNKGDKLPPEPCCNNSKEYFDKLKVDYNANRNSEFDKIKEKLMRQDETLKVKEKEIKDKEEVIIADTKVINKENLFLTSTSNTDDMNSVYEEIKRAELRCDDLLDDIDEVIKLGEDLDKIIETKYNEV